MTGNRIYHQIWKYWVWEDLLLSNIKGKHRKVFVKVAKKRLKRVFKKEIENETEDI